MKFYDRKDEMAALRRVEQVSAQYAQMTVITGRRRIGKTTTIKNALGKIPFLYFFVGKKSEALLCGELAEIVRDTLGEDLGDFTSFPRLFEVLMKLSKRVNFTLVLDEFQNIRYAREAIFSDLQDVWDSNKEGSHINLVICGSIYSKMKKIFDDKDEPLYGRATARFKMKPFSIATLKEILHDHNPEYGPDDLLALYMLTGGVAKYVEQLMMFGAFTKDAMLEQFFRFGSYFIDEGREMLVDEFGKDYGSYFSMLSAIADGRTSRGDIKNYTGIEPGGFLDKLENDFGIISKARPYLSGEASRNVRFFIGDNFLLYWFRYLYRYRSAVEIGNLEYVRSKAVAEYETVSGTILERYFRQLYRETGEYNIVSRYWKGDDMKDEIDLVAVDDAEKRVVIAECKRNPKKYDEQLLRSKAAAIVSHHKAYSIEYAGLSLKDMD